MHDRRTFLKSLGAAAVLAGFAGEGGAASERRQLIVGVAGGASIDDVRAAVAADPSIPSEANVVHHNEAIDYAVVEVPAGATAQASASAQNALHLQSSVRYVEGDYQPEPAVEEIQAVTPNDPQWGNEWADEAMNVPEAWETTMGSMDSTLAILDTGLDVTHPDLEDRVTSEVGGPDPVPSGSDDHGTHCGGCAAATTNNGVGVAGPTNSRLLGYNIFDNVRGEDAIVEASDLGADVISLSWSVGYTRQQSLHDAIQYATDNGTVVVAASANDGRTDAVSYPARDPNVIAVGATDQNGNVASFSNSGPNLDLVAPGVSILSTLPQGSYGNASGTSMACPCTAGVVALAKELDPSLTTEEVRTVLTDTATTLPGVPADRQAAGQVDAAAVVDAVAPTQQAPYGRSSGWPVPGRIQAEDFDSGGEGVAFHDTTAANDGGAGYRSTAVDIEGATEGGYNVCWVDSGEWWEYTVDVGSAGDYALTARVASNAGGGSFDVSVDGSQVASTSFGATGGWQAWNTVDVGTVSLSAGEHVVRVDSTANDWNLNWLEFASAGGGSGLVDGGTYRISNVNSGKALEVAGGGTANGDNVDQWAYADYAHQRWTINEVEDGVYQVLVAHTGKALDVDGVSQDPGANVHQWDYVGGANQHWRIEDTGDGTYRMIADHSGLALDVADGSTDDGANVLQWNYHGGANQRWEFELLY